ncbi:hypothetical protein F2P79_017452 [Pimephales promelas]|nr:hypothetical protein F2P79_017452 [Pimephales promelas]
MPLFLRSRHLLSRRPRSGAGSAGGAASGRTLLCVRERWALTNDALKEENAAASVCVCVWVSSCCSSCVPVSALGPGRRGRGLDYNSCFPEPLNAPGSVRSRVGQCPLHLLDQLHRRAFDRGVCSQLTPDQITPKAGERSDSSALGQHQPSEPQDLHFLSYVPSFLHSRVCVCVVTGAARIEMH